MIEKAKEVNAESSDEAFPAQIFILSQPPQIVPVLCPRRTNSIQLRPKLGGFSKSD